MNNRVYCITKLYSLNKVLVFVALLFISLQGFSQKAYIKKYNAVAQELSKEFGIPYGVILGVAIVESGSGSSRNAKILHNHFGIVGKNNIRKTHGIKSRYKQYASPVDSYRDFCKVVARKKFYAKMKGKTDTQAWITAISKTGYSEAPALWTSRINSVIKKNKLN